MMSILSWTGVPVGMEGTQTYGANSSDEGDRFGSQASIGHKY